MQPLSISKLGELRELYLINLELEGTIPTQVGGLEKLTHLSIAANHDLSGDIPSQLGNLTALQRLYIFSNSNIGGTMPPLLGLLPSLQQLHLHGNSLTGPVPAAYTKLAGASLQVSVAKALDPICGVII
jgi:Leucine-rich repeat (LRR) protein